MRPAPTDSPVAAAPPELPGLAHEEWDSTLRPILEDMGQPAYRAGLIADWLYRRGARSFADMGNLPKALRSDLDSALVLHPLTLEREQRSSDGTQKFLWARRGGAPIESVSIPEPDRRTFCVSTQSGCAVACTFCATGFGGFSGQLSAGEIVDQVLLGAHEAGGPPTNIVFMGMGEPLLNAEAVFRAIEVLTHPRQGGLSARRLTLSTVGIPRRIVELARRAPQVKLAVSLHATRDELRDEIIPLNRKYPLREILTAVRQHQSVTRKKVTFEYVVLPGTNDRREDAHALGRLLRGIPSRINLIGFNPFPGSPYVKPRLDALLWFRSQVERCFPGDVTLRRSRGQDIQGACGQLSLATKAKAPGAPSPREGSR